MKRKTVTVALYCIAILYVLLILGFLNEAMAHTDMDKEQAKVIQALEQRVKVLEDWQTVIEIWRCKLDQKHRFGVHDERKALETCLDLVLQLEGE